MATEKQIAANRANAKRSTGPKTTAGKQRSSRNSYRHGLSGPLSDDPAAVAATTGIAQAVMRDTGCQQPMAIELAEALVKLQTIRRKRLALLAEWDLDGARLCKPNRLLALDGYERRASSKRRSAVRAVLKRDER